jgi:DNA-binding transcriptional ArsR family regulator|uniref:ArsR family transcriptional regulator n=1 Tax=Dictyoglomus turgidum TaxID=513050 RepID=A0A7C3WQY4_9BACT
MKLKGEEIDRKILEYLEKIPFSATTEMIAKAIGVAWYSAQMHLHKLEKEGKVKFFRIGRQNQWILAGRIKNEVAMLWGNFSKKSLQKH